MLNNKKMGGILKKFDSFYTYYQKEMNYLRFSGANFAQKHPKVARRLDVSAMESVDPHVERLLESFAYLTARLQQDIDDQFPRFAEALLNLTYPQFTHPVPAMTIAHFEPHTHGGQMTTQHTIPAKTPLFTRTSSKTVCRFQTVYPVDIHPIKITALTLVAQSAMMDVTATDTLCENYLRMEIKAMNGTFASMGLTRLRFYINGSHSLKHQLLAAIFRAQSPLIIKSSRYNPQSVLPTCIHHVGFDDTETILPQVVQTHPGYQTLFEFFHFKDKFFFVDIITSHLLIDDTLMEIYIPLKTDKPLQSHDIHEQTLKLGCTPVVNLFPKVTEPITIDQRSHEYKLVADYVHEESTEIYSIDSVILVVSGSHDTQSIPSHLGRHFSADDSHKMSWTARRALTEHKTMGGTDVYVSLNHQNVNTNKSAKDTLFAHTLCTNRLLAHHIMADSLFHPEESIASQTITCLQRPSVPTYPSQDGVQLWQLVSHLALDHLGFDNSETAVQTMKDILNLYTDHQDSKLHQESVALYDLKIERVTRRLSSQAWRGFVMGSKITLTFNDDVNHEIFFLLGAVLNQFFALTSAVNTFTELAIRLKSQQGVWFTWPPRTGTKPLV